MSTYEYDEDCIPPAPKCEILVSTNIARIIKVGDEKSSMVKMLVDTGAEISAIPKKTVNELEKSLKIILPYDMIKAKGYDKVISIARRYNIKVRIKSGEHTFIHDIYAIEVDEEEGILGRDILNCYFITFKGPELIFTIERY